MPEQEEKKEGEQKEETVAKSEWDTEKQRADQAKANLDKAATERDAYADEIAQKEQKITELEDELKQKAADKGLDIEALDPMSADIADIVRQNKSVIKELDAAKTEIGELKNLAKNYQDERDLESAAKNKEATIEMILEPLDKKYGAKFRAEAKKLADEKIASGDIKQPGANVDRRTEAGRVIATLEARDLMEGCYKELADKDAKEKAAQEKVDVPADSGAGGVNWQEDQHKAGSRAEVLADMRKKGISKK